LEVTAFAAKHKVTQQFANPRKTERVQMVLRLVTTIVVLLFAIGAFCGAGPTRVGPVNPFGIFFLGLAALVWFAWKPMSAGFDQPGIWDAITRSWLGSRERKSGSDR
jgi:hypothetical protein